ncbi:MAG: aspartate carbamoyltransferase [Candidatus Neomarinimicrobiota bacterium]|nr:MAG: aspartate carbamoyltransferase [Candidatus Neomarinimicrobiota bacterium]
MKRDLISMHDLKAEDIQVYLDTAARVETISLKDRFQLLQGKIMASLFFEASTRTRLSFEAAMYRLGGNVIGFAEQTATSVSKGESFSDTIHTVESYSDVIVIRHPKEGTSRHAAQISYLPVINAGDGTNQHPTQTLLDLYTIIKNFKKIEGLRIAFVGDLKYSRTVHSLLQALIKFRVNEFMLVSPESLRLPEYLKRVKTDFPVTFVETKNLEDAIPYADIIYMTRIQRERFPDQIEYEKVKDAFCLNAGMLKNAPEQLKVLHPLPRVNEIAPDVDETPHAEYFRQAKNGLIMRQAILLNVFEVKI